MSQPEPWLRGPLAGIHPAIAPLLHSFQMAREDLACFTEGLSTEQLWHRTGNVNSVGREMKHIAGSVERLATYLEGGQLSTAQLEEMKAEEDGSEDREWLLTRMERAFQRAERIARALDPDRLTEPRSVGRKGLPTTAIGLLVHIAEHAQRHVGSAIVAAKLARIGAGKSEERRAVARRSKIT